MSQAANQTLAVPAQGDNYSIYSYKAGMDTLGPMSLHTETIKSTKSRASPQYRVSDIDPEYARRYEGEKLVAQY